MDGLIGTFAHMDPSVIGWGLGGGAVWMILTGKLVPRALYAEQKQSAETWRAAWQTERDNLTKLVVPNAELQREVLKAIPAQPAPTDRQGEPV